MAKRAKRKPKSRPIYVSKKLELDYTRALLKIVKAMHKDTVAALMPLLESPNVGDGVMVADSFLGNIKTAISKLTASIGERISKAAAKLVPIIVGKQQAESDSRFAQQILDGVGLGLEGLLSLDPLDDILDEAIKENIRLIESIPEQYFERIEKAVLENLEMRMSKEWFANSLAKIENITKNRAKLIARDQLGKINGRISQARQEAAGITHYTWLTCLDEAVRGNPNARYYSIYSHYKRESMVFAWSNPPGDGHPGEPINCRCIAEPYTAHLTGGLTAEEVMARQPDDLIFSSGKPKKKGK